MASDKAKHTMVRRRMKAIRKELARIDAADAKRKDRDKIPAGIHAAILFAAGAMIGCSGQDLEEGTDDAMERLCRAAIEAMRAELDRIIAEGN